MWPPDIGPTAERDEVTRHPIVLVLGALMIVSACAGRSEAGSESAATDAPATSAPTTTTTTTTPPTTTSTPPTTTSTTTTTTTATTTTATTSTTTTTLEPLPDAAMMNSHRAFDDLAAANPAVSMTVVRDGRSVLQRASGTTVDGAAATSDSPMVVASVSKLVTALTIARLDQAGAIDVDAPVPWAEIPIATHPGWTSVSVRELLAHTSGMPVVRPAWFDGEIDCPAFLSSLVEAPPTTTRGRWTYSNGNYCALGLLIQAATGLPLDRAAQSILLDPLGRSGVHLTTDGQLPSDVEYGPGVARLSRLGGAGAFIVSTDDIAGVLAGVTPTDLETLRWPGILVDQYGWGHTGSVDDAVACAWVLDGGRTVVAATVAGGSPATGGAVCDRIVPAVADDLGVGRGRPDRSPP